MLNNIWFIAAIWMGLALAGSLISIWTGISVALVEILVGVVAGNIALGFEGGTLQIGIVGGNIDAGQLHHVLQSTEWTNFLAMLGAGVLTFLAGAEIDPHSLKSNWRASVLIGVLSFAIPFGVVWFVAQLVFGWSLHQAQIAEIARTLKLRRLHVYPIHRSSKMIFGFCANGKLLTRSLWSAANDFSREHPLRATELQRTEIALRRDGYWKLRVIHVRS